MSDGTTSGTTGRLVEQFELDARRLERAVRLQLAAAIVLAGLAVGAIIGVLVEALIG